MPIFIAFAVFVLCAVGTTYGLTKLWVKPKEAIERIAGANSRQEQAPVHPSLIFHDIVKRLGNLVPASPKDVTVMHDIVHLHPPARIHVRTDVVSRGEIVAIRVELRAFVDGKAGIIHRFAVHEHGSMEQMNVISRHSDNPFHEVLVRVHWIAEHNNVAATDL